jgi:uncharacterized protein YjbJ (UPF0337 family)
MNRDIAQGQWKRVKGKARDMWGLITDDELEQIGGKFQGLVGKVQEKYGLAKDEAEEQVGEFLDGLDEGGNRTN